MGAAKNTPNSPDRNGISSELEDRPSSPAESEADFFKLSQDRPPEIVEGLIRERQIGTLTGAFGVGKSPLLVDLEIHVVHGKPWLGRRTVPRPVVVFDFETPGNVYRRNATLIKDRLGVRYPDVPSELEVHLALDSSDSPAVKWIRVIADRQPEERADYLLPILTCKPNALVVIDPVELFFSFDKLRTAEILQVYRCLRQMLQEFPKAAFLLTFNLRKKDRSGGRPNLLTEPRSWLEEIAGSLDLMNRCDVRLGIDFHDEDPEIRVINGVRRGEDMHPILIRQVGTPPDWAGFELARPGSEDLFAALTDRQRKYWDDLPDEFRFEEVADETVPRSSLFRLLERARSLGLLTKHRKVYRKNNTSEE